MSGKTDISPEAVEHLAQKLEQAFREVSGGRLASIEATTLRAQAARIAEMEADLNTLRSYMPNRRAYNLGQAIGRASRQVEVDRLTTEAQAARTEALREAAAKAEGWFGTPDADDIAHILHGEITDLIEKGG